MGKLSKTANLKSSESEAVSLISIHVARSFRTLPRLVLAPPRRCAASHEGRKRSLTIRESLRFDKCKQRLCLSGRRAVFAENLSWFWNYFSKDRTGPEYVRHVRTCTHLHCRCTCCVHVNVLVHCNWNYFKSSLPSNRVETARAIAPPLLTGCNPLA